MNKNIPFGFVGGSSILTIFAVLCLMVFTLLSMSTAKANDTLAEKSMAATTNFYKADVEAEEVLAQLRSGKCPEGVTKEGNYYSYVCEIDSNQQLQIKVLIENDDYEILEWKKVYVGEWKSDDSLNVWDGAEITE